MTKEDFGRRSFVFGVAVDDYNFTDRAQETLQLLRNFEAVEDRVAAPTTDQLLLVRQ